MANLSLFAWVFIGAFFGGLARWALSHIPAPRVGTFTANIVACAVLGFTLVFPAPWQAGLGAGFAGALSTWSTLAKECGELYKRRQWGKLAKYASFTAAMGIAAAGWGVMISRRGMWG
ncbi:CrcB family protein [Corynebacterium sp. Q4381]|uniref:FluC/FEX family fluoride channel n=1 Tax=Corynebacterium sp. Marseille-Q4381 TaxID=3121597 RepID=UPI002FE53135